MDWRLEIRDPFGLRRAVVRDSPLLEIVRESPDGGDRIRGLLPAGLPAIGPGDEVRVYFGTRLVCAAPVVSTAPEWSDTRKLILDRYIPFQRVLAFEAEGPRRRGNSRVTRAYVNREIGAMAKDLVNSALGPVHYTVAHAGPPEGAQREYAKFDARRTPGNELEIGGIAAGQWVGADRIAPGSGHAKDGDTIAGLVVDGAPWPELRLMLIDAEESERNSRAIRLHPEVAEWTDAEYAQSGYKLRADAATARLQALIDAHGIEAIELNPHRDASGAFDDRVDAFGRYLGFVYGGGKCYNADLVEHGLAEVFLYEGGRYHVPEMALKEYFSYTGAHQDSIVHPGVALGAFDARGGVLEVLAALAYAAGGFVFHTDPSGAVHFRPAEAAPRLVTFQPELHGVAYGASRQGLVNLLIVEGHPYTGSLRAVFPRGESIDRHGVRARFLEYFSLSREEDAERLAQGLLADLAYPAISGALTFFQGDPDIDVGDLIEVRGAPVRRLDPALPDEWDGRFAGRLAARVRRVRHRIHGRRALTEATLGPPLRSAGNPLGFLVRGQESAARVFEFRLDDEAAGLDMAFHLG